MGSGAAASALILCAALGLGLGAGPVRAEAKPCPGQYSAAASTVVHICRAEAAGLVSLAQFKIEIADTPEARERGLMQRRAMAPDAGMLFVYPSPRQVAFWMHDTLLPLDMLFIDADGMIVRLHENARPLDETPIPSGGAVRFVLEIGGGMAAHLGLAPGMVLPQLADWPQ